MKFHWPSFLLGCGIGAMGALGEDAEDMLAEARARAHSARPSPRGRARR